MQAPGRRVTIRDVAHAAGVSTATVSQVLNGRRPVAEATRLRIEEVIAELRYRPNTFARALKTLRSQLVGVVLPDLSNPFYPSLVRGVQQRLSMSGYHAVVVNTDADRAQERELVAELVDRQVDGLVLITFTLSDSDYSAIAAMGVPFVVVGRTDGFDHVHTSDYAAAFEMTTYLLDAGYGSIAHLAGPEARARVPRRPVSPGTGPQCGSGGCVAPRHEWSMTSSRSRAVTRPWCSSWSRKGRPRAVFCANDLMAIGAIEAARAYGLRVPDDLAVAGFDDIHAASLVWPSLTTVGYSAGELGAKAAGLLLDRMSGGEGPPVDVEVGFELKKRESA